jgi:hypothetical protein
MPLRDADRFVVDVDIAKTHTQLKSLEKQLPLRSIEYYRYRCWSFFQIASEW